MNKNDFMVDSLSTKLIISRLKFPFTKKVTKNLCQNYRIKQ